MIIEMKISQISHLFSRTQEIAGTFNISSTAFPTTNLTDVENSIFDAFEMFEKEGFTIEDLID